MGIRGNHSRNMAGPGSRINGPDEALGSEVEFMISEGGGIVTHSGHKLQFAADLASRRAKRRPHTVVARIEHQHRTLSIARFLALRDQAGKPRARRAYKPSTTCSP